MDKNKDYSPIGFLGHHVYWGLLLTWCYRVTLFRIHLPFDKPYSAALLYILVGVCLLFGYLITVFRNRSLLNLIVTVLTPFELYTILMLWHDRHTLILISAAIAFLISAVLFLRGLIRPIRRPERSRSIIMRRVKAGLINSRLIIGLCMSSVLFAAVTNYQNMIHPSETIFSQTILSEEELARETLLLTESLCAEHWYRLSTEERMQCISRLVELECQYLGIPYQLDVTTDHMPSTRHGMYSQAKYRISINADLLKNHAPIEVVSTTLHECYHAYQHALINLYLDSDAQYQNLRLFSQIKQYANELVSYKNPGDPHITFQEYFTQQIEEEARKYAEENIYRYFPENVSCGSGS